MLNTLYVNTQGAYLHKEGETVVVEVKKEVKLRVPLINLSSIVCFGNVMCSPFLLGACAKADICVSHLTEHGRFLASIRGSVSGNVLLRREQYRRADKGEAAFPLAKSFVTGKIANAKTFLRRSAREGAMDSDAVSGAADALDRCLQRMALCENVDSLRGTEGEASRTYFSVFDHLLMVRDEGFFFKDRNRRPPLDRVNALLSFTYTLLMHDITGALETHGLDPCVGYLHSDRPGRKSLALDVMEEFRSSFADRFVLSLINRRQIKGSDFETLENGAILLKEKPRKELLAAYQRRKQEEIEHPFLEEKMPIGMLFHAQALLLARHLRGDIEAYPPFYWK